MNIAYLFAGAVTLAACATGGPPVPFEESLIGPHLGESTASPGSDPNKPHPVAPNDPRVMNVSVGISPQYYVEPIVTGPVASSTVVVNQPVPVPVPPSPEAVGLPPQPPPQPETSTSSTPVSQLPDIAPPSTAQPDVPVKGVFSPPPPSQE